MTFLKRVSIIELVTDENGKCNTGCGSIRSIGRGGTQRRVIDQKKVVIKIP